MEATQGALIRLEHWSEYWCLPLNPRKCKTFFFLVDPHQANLWPNLLILSSRLHFNSTPTFLGVAFDRTLSFSKHVFLLKAKFFPRLKALCCISAFACAILHALCWSRQHQQVGHFSSLLLLSDSRSVSPPCPVLHLSSYLKLGGRSGRNCLLCPPVLSGYNGSLDSRFSQGTTRLMSWPDGERYLRPP